MLNFTGEKVLNRIRTAYYQLYSKYLLPPQPISLEAIRWSYRLFLAREPENMEVIADKMNRLNSLEELRQEFTESDEFKYKNPQLYSGSTSGSEPPMQIEAVQDLQELFSHIQKVWEQFGETEPYWSVATAEQFKSSQIQASTRKIFYDSGEHEVEKFIKTLDRNNLEYSSFKTCLEYGCGLGRVTSWLAKKFDHVIGYDISKSHLQLAEQYLEEIDVHNVSLYQITKPQDMIDFPKVDVIYSVIVLQHNPPPLILQTIRELLRALNTGGVAFFQVPTYQQGYTFILNEYIENQVGKDQMEMHVVPQKEIFQIISEERCCLIEIFEDGWTGQGYGSRSNTFVIQKM